MVYPRASERQQAVSGTSDVQPCSTQFLRETAATEKESYGRIIKMTKCLPLLCASDTAS